MAMKDEGLTFLIKIFLLTVISSPGKMEADGVVMANEGQKLAWWAAHSDTIPHWAGVVKKLLKTASYTIKDNLISNWQKRKRERTIKMMLRRREHCTKVEKNEKGKGRGKGGGDNEMKRRRETIKKEEKGKEEDQEGKQYMESTREVDIFGILSVGPLEYRSLNNNRIQCIEPGALKDLGVLGSLKVHLATHGVGYHIEVDSAIKPSDVTGKP
ncbi:unnamed protein product [Porites lobata]|uniref:Uncharacterized protein n=1 Tax=Porites lobata TaxID=104759 RepID=A0ABN8PA16_9CNID|nr:unnamed protein product [Porites lobata]